MFYIQDIIELTNRYDIKFQVTWLFYGNAEFTEPTGE